MGSADAPPPPPKADPGGDLINFVSGLRTAMPDVLNIERTSRPQFGEMNLADMSSFLYGTGDQAGVLGLGSQATGAAQQELQGSKSAELAGLLGNAGAARAAHAALDPETANLVARQNQLASERYDAAGTLNPQEKRIADQTAREAFASRGRLNDNASVAAEILGREEVLAAKRSEAAKLGFQGQQMAQQYGAQTTGMARDTAPATLLGQDYLNRAGSIVGNNVPQLIDTGTAIGLGQQDRANLANWQSNVTAANNANSAQNTQLAASAASTALIALAAFSDERAKTDKKKVGKLDDGTPVYTYRLLGDPKTQMGVMAQDLKGKKSKALGPIIGGLKTVDYSKL